MKRAALIIYFAILTAFLLATPTGKVFAACSGFTTTPDPIQENQAASFTIPIGTYLSGRSGNNWSVEFVCSGWPSVFKTDPNPPINNAITVTLDASDCAVNPTEAGHTRLFNLHWNGTNPGIICSDNYTTVGNQSSGQYCTITLSTTTPSINDTIKITATNTSTKPLGLWLNPHGGGSGQTAKQLAYPIPPNPPGGYKYEDTIGPLAVDDYDVYMRENGLHSQLCSATFHVSTTGGVSAGAQPQDVCSLVATDKQAECKACALKNNNSGVWTALGCITTDPKNLLGTILRLGLGLAGGIAFLLILFGGLQIMTSAGNPEQLNAGRELITSAIIGLILILFSIFLLQFIGVNIIGIPGFT